MVLSEGSQSYPFWKDIPVPIYERFYFFNITNPLEIERFGAKPKLAEVGPFTYRMYMNKTNIVWNSNGTVTFKEKKTWVFLPHLSVSSDEFLITTLNVPLAMTLTLIQSATSAVRVIVNLALEALTEGFFIKRSVRQLLYEGYPDTLTSFAPLLNPNLNTYSNGRFAWFNGKNGSADGVYTIFTGATGMDKYAIIDRYNNRSHLPYWLNEDCNSFKDSTNGELRPPFAFESPQPKSLRLFHPDLCRILELDYNSTYDSHEEGIKAVRYTLSQNTFKNSIDYPPNSCYDTKYVRPTPSPLSAQGRIQSLLSGLSRRSGPGDSPLLPTPQPQSVKYTSGVFDISKCKFGVPIVVSRPHFLGGDYYRTVVDGMRPNPSKHDFWMELEPSTGTTIGLTARVQINLAINKGPGIRYRNIPNIVFPAFWQEVTMTMTPAVASELWMAAHMPSVVASVSSASFFTLGTLFMATGLVLLIVRGLKAIVPSIRRSFGIEESEESSSDAVKGKSLERKGSQVKTIFSHFRSKTCLLFPIFPN
jgi:hypothetical protein